MTDHAQTPSSSFVPAASVEDLDTAIVRLSSQVACATFRLLVLVREFDDRLGWANGASRIARSG